MNVKYKGVEIDIDRGSVIASETQAIVNAANCAMRGGGGIDGAIHKAAGPELLEQLKVVAPNGAKTSEPVVTNGFGLRQKYVIHVAGPIYDASEHMLSCAKLSATYTNALIAAKSYNIKTIGLCSISTGIYRFPLNEGAEIAMEVVKSHIKKGTSLTRIDFCMFQDAEYDAFIAAFNKQFKWQITWQKFINLFKKG